MTPSVKRTSSEHARLDTAVLDDHNLSSGKGSFASGILRAGASGLNEMEPAVEKPSVAKWWLNPRPFVFLAACVRSHPRKRIEAIMSTAIVTASGLPRSLAGRMKAALRAEESRTSTSLGAPTPSAATASDASTTVSLSSAALGFLEGIGESAVEVVKGAGELVADVVEAPLTIAGDVAGGLVHAAEDVANAGWDVITGGVGGFGSDAGAAAKVVLVDVPTSVAKDVESDAKSIVEDAATLGSGVLGLSTVGLA